MANDEQVLAGLAPITCYIPQPFDPSSSQDYIPHLHKTTERPIATPHNHPTPQLRKAMKGATVTPNNHSTP